MSPTAATLHRLEAKHPAHRVAHKQSAHEDSQQHRSAAHHVQAPAAARTASRTTRNATTSRTWGYSARSTFEAAPSQTALQGSERERFQQMWPSIQRYATQYGVRPETVAAVIRQESDFQNLRVHNDGTGHGIAGLDDGGRRTEFERWSGEYIGPGRNANVVSVDRQIEFLARTLGSNTRRYGSEDAAVREWHRGAGHMNDAGGYQYQALIARHRRELFN